MQKNLAQVFVLACTLLFLSSCIDCETCIQTSVTRENGEITSTSTRSPFEVCGREEINIAEYNITTTTMFSDRIIETTRSVACD